MGIVKLRSLFELRSRKRASGLQLGGLDVMGVRSALLVPTLFFTTSAMAIGLGEMHVHSGLGQPLNVQIDLIGSNGADIGGKCFKLKLSTLDGAEIGKVSYDVKSGSSSAVITFTTAQPVNEPAATLSVAYSCSSTTSRDYQVLLDLPKIDAPVIELPRLVSSTTIHSSSGRSSSGRSGSSSGSDSGSKSKKSSHHHHKTTGNSARAVDEHSLPEFSTTDDKPQKTHKDKSSKKSSSKEFHNVLRLDNDSGNNLDDVTGMRLVLTHGLHGTSKNEDAQLSAAQTVKPGNNPVPITNSGKNVGVNNGAVNNGVGNNGVGNNAGVNGNAADQGKPVVNSGAPADMAAGNPVPPVGADPAVAELQAKIQTLKAETDALKKANTSNLAALEAAKQRNKENSGAGMYLYFLLAACIAVIGWLTWRTRQIQSERNSLLWNQMVPGNEEPQNKQAKAGKQAPKSFLDEEDALPKPKDTNKSGNTAAVTPATQGKPNVQPGDRKPTPAPVDEITEGDYKFLGNVRNNLPNAEEILDEIQQAEFWMDMQQPQRAIEILESNWGVERPSSPLPWLYLFDLYRMVKDKEKYEELTGRFEQIFNGKAAPWGDGGTPEHSRSLEDFPVLMSKIDQIWGTDEAVVFLENLLIDDRDGRREGFDLSAYRDILFLANIAYELQSSLPPSSKSAEPDWSAIK